MEKVAELAGNLKTIYGLDNIDSILKAYVSAITLHGVIDFRIESTYKLDYFEDRAAVLDSKWASTWEDWDVEAFQFATGLLENVFVVLLYRPED